MLTATETQLIGDLLLLRADEDVRGVELWAVVSDDLAVEAERLTARGYLERRWDCERSDLVYRATDQAVRAQELHANLAATVSSN